MAWASSAPCRMIRRGEGVIVDKQCPACRGPGGVDSHLSVRDRYVVRCLRCSQFEITGSAHAILANQRISPRQIANLSGWIRERHGCLITEENCDELLRLRTPTVGEKAE